MWFRQVLTEGWCKAVPYSLDELQDKAIVYTDAESDGNTATVIITSHTRLCYYGRVPQRLRRHLRRRKTNIVAFELLAAIMGVLQMQALGVENVGVRHFIDSNPARQCMVKACAKHDDLNNLVGMLWFMAGKTLRRYYCEYVPSASNLADAPSRGDFSLVTRLGARVIRSDFSTCVSAVESWMASMSMPALVE